MGDKKKNQPAEEVVETPESRASEVPPELETLQTRLSELEDQLQQARQREQRALADYQNVVRRTREDQSRFAKLATADFVTSLIQPLEHLQLAAQQLNDPGLNMVVGQFLQAMSEHGLKQLDVLGQPFDLKTMEVVEKESNEAEDKLVVVKVLRPGYTLHGEVVQHAKVVLGKG